MTHNLNLNKMADKISRQAAEEAIAAWKAYKDMEREAKAAIAGAEAVIDTYAREHIAEFEDDKLALTKGIIAIRAGAAKPIKDGKALSTVGRTELAAVLPSNYVKITCDYAQLYGCDDKRVRQILEAFGVQIKREDKYTVL